MGFSSTAFIAVVAGLAFYLGKSSVDQPPSAARPPVPAAPEIPAPEERPSLPPPPAAAQPVQESPVTVKDLIASRNRITRLTAMLELIAKSSESGQRRILDSLSEAFDQGLLDSNEIAIFAEAMGQRGDTAVAARFLASPMARQHHEFAVQFFRGWAESSSKDSLDYITSKIPPSDHGQLLAAMKGFTLSCSDSMLLNELAEDFPNEALRITGWKTEAEVRRTGYDSAISTALAYPLPKGDVIGNCDKLTALKTVGDLAASTTNTAFMNFMNATVGSKADADISVALPATMFADRDYKGAFEYGLTLPPGDKRSVQLGTAVFNAGRKNPDEAIALVRNMPAGSIAEQKQIITSLQNAFRQTDRISKQELPDLMLQTDELLNKLKTMSKNQAGGHGSPHSER